MARAFRVLVVRHAPAGDRAAYAKTGRPDAGRPLTERGRAKMKKAARGLRFLAGRVAAIATSPLTRARQTTALLAKQYPRARLTELTELEPGRDPAALLMRLKTLASPVAAVGHEPQLSAFVAFCLGGPGLKAPLKKGGACLLEFSGEPRRGGASLLWSVPPKVLRALSKGA
jgi:phosphohistidine phosphatase